MTNITMIYDTFSATLKFFIDGNPLPNISQLSKFQQRSFVEWCPQIFPVAYEEINEDYSMTYVGRGCEARMLAYYSKADTHCRCFSTKVPVIPDSALKRLKKLHMLCMNGLMYKKYTKEIAVFTDLPAEEAQSIFKQALPKLCFCILRVNCYPLSQWKEAREPFFVLTSESGGRLAREMLKSCPVENHLIMESSQTRFCGIEGNTYIDESRTENFSMVLQESLEFGLYPEILRKTMDAIQLKDASHPQYYNFMALNKVEPVTIPVFPLSMEFGQKKEIELKTIPEGFAPDTLTYRISSEEILRIQDNVMMAVGSGEVIVEAYLPGQSVRIASASIKVVRRNRITELKLIPDEMELCVGDLANVKYAYRPADADNSSTIKFYSMDGTVASIKQNGEINARKPGMTNVMVQTDNGVKGSCSVTVYPKLEKIKLTMQQDKIRCGEYCSVKAERVPAGATLDPLVFSVDPPYVAEYDAGSKIIVTKTPGEAVLRVTDSRHSVEARCFFTVKKKGLFR